MIYLDTSALAKLIVSEFETVDLRDWLVNQIARRQHIATSTLGRVELMRAVARLNVPRGAEVAQQLLAGLDLLPLSDAVMTLAQSVGPATLRSLDAIHLAAAMQFGSELSALVTYDHRLRNACRDVGVVCVSPGAII